jgi:sodium transport system permease protein
MRLTNVLLIFRKELRDVLRDRRTLIATFVLPVVLYPAFVIGFAQVTAVQRGRQAQTTQQVAVVGARYAPDLLALISPKDDHLEWTEAPAADERALLDGQVQLIVVIPPDFQDAIRSDTTAQLSVQFDQSSDRSRLALEWFRGVVDRYRERELSSRLEGLRPPQSQAFIEPVRLVSDNRAPETQVLLSLAGGMLVFLAVMMALSGAFYPAVDACAGEKERGTIETLLVSPATRPEIVMGKYALVLGMSITTAILNLLVMALTVFAMMGVQGTVPGAPEPLGVRQVAQAMPSLIWVLVLLIPVAAFFSALALALASFARSNREAQYYLLPLYLIALPLASMGAIPGVEMSYLLDLTPVAGAAVVFRQLLAGRGGVLPHAILVFVANFVYAAVAIRWAAGLFRREEVLFREAEEFDWRFWRWRSFRSLDGRPTAAHVILVLGMAFVLQWYLAGVLTQVGRPAPAQALALVVTVLAPPLVIAGLMRLRRRVTFPFRTVHPLALALTVPLGGGLNLLLGQMMYALRSEVVAPPGMEEFIREMLVGRHAAAWTLLALALTPAICEEVLFRGFVLSGLRSRMGAVSAVAGSALLFGLFHLNAAQFLFAVPAGLMLGALALRTRSLVPPMLLHLTNNLLAVLLIVPETWLAAPDAGGALAPLERATLWLRRQVLSPETAGHPLWIILGAAALVLVCAWLIYRLTNDRARGGSEPTANV